MASAVFHIELRVQNVETKEHTEAIGKAIERAASLIANDALLILGEQCDPQLTAYSDDFANGRRAIALRSPDEVI